MTQPQLQKQASNINGIWAQIVNQKLEQVRFGIIQLKIHEGRVVQIECTERTRLSQQCDNQTQPNR
jgi:hypothetical protein